MNIQVEHLFEPLNVPEETMKKARELALNLYVDMTKDGRSNKESMYCVTILVAQQCQNIIGKTGAHKLAVIRDAMVAEMVMTHPDLAPALKNCCLSIMMLAPMIYASM